MQQGFFGLSVYRIGGTVLLGLTCRSKLLSSEASAKEERRPKVTEIQFFGSYKFKLPLETHLKGRTINMQETNSSIR